MIHDLSLSLQNIIKVILNEVHFLGLSTESLVWHYKWTWYDFCDKCLIKRTLFERGKCIDYLLGLGLNCVDQMTEKFYQKLLNKYNIGVTKFFWTKNPLWIKILSKMCNTERNLTICFLYLFLLNLAKIWYQLIFNRYTIS